MVCLTVRPTVRPTVHPTVIHTDSLVVVHTADHRVQGTQHLRLCTVGIMQHQRRVRVLADTADHRVRRILITAGNGLKRKERVL